MQGEGPQNVCGAAEVWGKNDFFPYIIYAWPLLGPPIQ